MKRFSEQLHKESESVKLRAAEKRELRERLVSYMEYHPLPAELKAKKVVKTPNKTQQILTDAFTTVSIPFSMIFRSSAVAAALVLVVVPFAAEKAVPGDTLYAVKVHVNEDLRSVLTFDSYQKVEWETERLNRRIAEAKLLASEGRLTDEVEAEVAEAVKVHTENAKREIEELRTLDADEAAIAAIELDTTLEVQAASLRADDTNLSVETGIVEVSLIAEAIDESLEQTEEYATSEELPAYDKLMARIEQNTTRIYELLATVSEMAPEEQMGDVTRRIEDIERAITVAVEVSESNNEASQVQMVDVLQRTQKLIVYMTEFRVIETIDIETLVPVVLTGEEEAVVSSDLSEEIDVKLIRIEELLIQVEDVNVLEKVSFTQGAISELSVKLASTTENFEGFETVSAEMLALIDDVIIMLEQNLEPAVEEESDPVEPEKEPGESGNETEGPTDSAEVEEQIESDEEPIEEKPTEQSEDEQVDPVEPNDETEVSVPSEEPKTEQEAVEESGVTI